MAHREALDVKLDEKKLELAQPKRKTQQKLGKFYEAITAGMRHPLSSSAVSVSGGEGEGDAYKHNHAPLAFDPVTA